jgi:activating signal cointegrator 1
MKALSLTQPWASLVQCKAKSVETRSWYTSYRGPLVIHAAKGYPGWCKEFACEPYTRDALGCRLDPLDLPRAVGLCVVTLVACVKTTDLDKLKVIGHRLQVNEISFGDYSEGRFAWALRHEYDFPEPIPAVGALGLWDWEHGVQQSKLKSEGDHVERESSKAQLSKTVSVSGVSQHSGRSRAVLQREMPYSGLEGSSRKS